MKQYSARLHNSTALAQLRQTRLEGALAERYRFILQQIHTVNENVYRFLALYQTLATALASGGLALFVGYRRWGISAVTARAAEIALLLLLTLVATFTILLILAGVLNWLDYRREECNLLDRMGHPEIRQPPALRNLFRWYETYILMFISASVIFLWVYTEVFILPGMA